MLVFVRASLFNVFMVAKLFYVFQVLHCTWVNNQSFHRIFVKLIWKTISKPMKRENLFRSLDSGGLVLTHLSIKQLLRDKQNPFLRTVGQVTLTDCIPNFTVTKHDVQSTRMSGFLKEVLHPCQFLTVTVSMEYLRNVTRKKVSQDLINSLFPVPLCRSMYSDGPGQDMLACKSTLDVRSTLSKDVIF